MNVGFKVSRGKNVLSTSGKQLAFSSSYPLDMILATPQITDFAHGLGYKPTFLSWSRDGKRGLISYATNYEIEVEDNVDNDLDERAIVLFQQGT